MGSSSIQSIWYQLSRTSQQTILLDEGECKHTQHFSFSSTILSKWLTSASASSFQLMFSLLLAFVGSLKQLGDHECVSSCSFDSLYCTHQVLLDNLRKLRKLYLGILYSSIHLENLDLLYYVVSLFLSFSLVSLGYDFP